MARSAAERYLVAAFAFVAAATWLGVDLMSGLACLFVFVVAFQAVRIPQRRRGSSSSRVRSRRDRGYIYDPASTEAQIISASPERRPDRHRRSSRLYDVDREGLGWPMASEAT